MTDWKDALDNVDLTTTEGLEDIKRRFVEQNREQQIKSLKDEENSVVILDTFGAIAEYNNFIEQSERPRVEVMAWDKIPDVDREWLIPQWLPANTVTMFTGDGGAGKSWLTLQAVCQIACGFQDAFLNPDYKITHPADYDDDPRTSKHVVFATYEDEPAEIKRRLQSLTSSMPWIADSMDTIKEHVHIVDMRGIGSVWGPGLGNHIANTGDLLPAGEDLRAICEQKNANLLVMDPLSGAFGGNENDRSAVYDFVSSFRGWGDETQCAVLAIGHLPKGAEGRAAGFSGSTAWEASVRSLWMLSKKDLTNENGNQKETKHYWAFEQTKNNYAALQPSMPLIKSNFGSWFKADSLDDAIDGYDAYQAGLSTQPTQKEAPDDTEDDYNPYENAFR